MIVKCKKMVSYYFDEMMKSPTQVLVVAGHPSGDLASPCPAISS